MLKFICIIYLLTQSINCYSSTNVHWTTGSDFSQSSGTDIDALANDGSLQLLTDLGLNNDYDWALCKKLKELSVYSYFLGDKDSPKILGNFLKKKFDSKTWFYHKMALLGIKHPANWSKKYKQNE